MYMEGAGGRGRGREGVREDAQAISHFDIELMQHFLKFQSKTNKQSFVY